MLGLINHRAPRRGTRQLCSIPIMRIAPNPYQPRRSFSEAQLRELSESIRRYGLLSPVVVRRAGEEEFQLIAGERRLRACKMLNMERIDALILPAFEQDAALIALIENLQREQLNCFEEAEAYAALIQDHGLSQEELARRLGKSASAVANKLRLLRLNGALRSSILEAHLSERHARALLKLGSDALRAQALKAAIEQQMSVKQLEALIEQMLSAPVKLNPPKRLYRDHRFFINTVFGAVRQLKAAGVPAVSRVEEKSDRIEVIVSLPKIAAHSGHEEGRSEAGCSGL